MNVYNQNIYFKYQNQSENSIFLKKNLLEGINNFKVFSFGKIDCGLIIWEYLQTYPCNCYRYFKVSSLKG